MFSEMLHRLETDPLWVREYEDFVRQVSFAGPVRRSTSLMRLRPAEV
jgi:hypothetical protein